MPARAPGLPLEWLTWPPDQPARQALIRCCAHCEYVTPNRINPAAAIGGCRIGKGNHYPMEQHNCSDFERAHK